MTESLETLVNAVFPFNKDKPKSESKELDLLNREVAKGPISFKPVDTKGPFIKAAKKLTIDEDFVRKLKNKR